MLVRTESPLDTARCWSGLEALGRELDWLSIAPRELDWPSTATRDWLRLKDHWKLVGTKSPWSGLKALWMLLGTENPQDSSQD
ncbi:hypothetical protein BHM03_00040507 [Ensete ventricosum]|nr:hypothetical protein BHM03_00040507 [Ensete ventricosum]